MYWMKRMAALITSAAMCILCLPVGELQTDYLPSQSITAYAISGECGKNVKWEVWGDTLTISGSGKMESHPWSYDSANVNTEKIKTIVLKNGVTSICDWAFSEFVSLAEVEIADTVEQIGSFAFYRCYQLESIVIPDDIVWLKDSTFSNCTKLTSVTIPPSVQSIEQSTFTGCSNLTIYGVPGSAAETFANTNKIQFRKMGDLCGKKLTWVLDENGTLTIKGTGPMYDYTYDNPSPFYRNTNVKKLVIQSGVTSIGEKSFYDCDNLTSVTIPNSVTSIRSNAFISCKSLTSVTIPDSVTSIEVDAFEMCSGLTSIIVSTGNSNYTSIDGVLYSKDKNVLITYPCGKKGACIIPDSVTRIGEYAFWDCKDLTSLTIPNSVTSIGENAFAGCSHLTSVTIPESVTSIGANAFGRCKILTSVTIPNSVTSIGQSAFRYCESLTSVTIPDSVINIGKFAFADCTSLTSVTILNPKCEIYNLDSTFCNSYNDGDCPFTGTIYGYPGSTAEAYAKKYDRKFVALDSIQPTETTTPTTSLTTSTTPQTTTTSKAPQTTTSTATTSAIPQTTTTSQTTTTTATSQTTTTQTTETTTTTTTNSLILPQDPIRLRAEKTYRIPQVKSDLTYVSLNPDIADVTANGLVMALTNGTASIKITDSTGTSTVLTVDVVTADTAPYPLGNLNGDDLINAKDATIILIAAARLGTGDATGFTDEQTISADVNGDGSINAKDATAVLRYAAAVGTGSAGKLTDYI